MYSLKLFAVLTICLLSTVTDANESEIYDASYRGSTMDNLENYLESTTEMPMNDTTYEGGDTDVSTNATDVDMQLSKFIFGPGLDVVRATKAMKMVKSTKNLVYEMVNGSLSPSFTSKLVVQTSKTLISLNTYLEVIRKTNGSFTAPIVSILAIDNAMQQLEAESLISAETLIIEFKALMDQLSNAFSGSDSLLRKKRTVSSLDGEEDIHLYLDYGSGDYYDYELEDVEMDTGLDLGLMDMIGGKFKKPFVKLAKTKVFITAKIFKTIVMFLKKLKYKITKIGKWISNLPGVGKLGSLYNSFSYDNIHASLVGYLASLDFVNVDALQHVDFWNLTLDDVENVFEVDDIGHDIVTYLQDWEGGITGTLSSFIGGLTEVDRNVKSFFKKKW